MFRHPGWRRFSRVVGWLAPVIVALWIGGTVASLILIRPLSPTGARQEFAGAISTSAPPLMAQKDAIRRFGYPLIAQNVVVQYRRGGLSLRAQVATASTAVSLDRGQIPGLSGIKAAVPVTNALKLFPGSRQAGTTALTYLFVSPSSSPGTARSLADEYARRYLSAPGDGLVGVTGAYQAEAVQSDRIAGSLTMVEYASIAIVLVIVGITYRSVVAPLLTLLTAGMAYELSQRILSLMVSRVGISVPDELDPVIVVLLFGIVTDYSVFYLSALRRRLTDSDSPRSAVRKTVVEATPLVLVASATVAMGVALSAVARLPLFASLAPGLAISVGVVMVAVTTFIPAALYLLRSVALWPSARRTSKVARTRRRLQFSLTRRLVGVPVLAIGLGGLIFLSVHVGAIKLVINLVGDLPTSTQVVRASDAAARGFAPGAVEPTEILIHSTGAAGTATQMSTVQAELAHVPGVGGVIGPGNVPSSFGIRNVFVSADGHYARYLVLLAAQPLSAAGIEDLGRIQSAMPGILDRAGMHDFGASYAGDTALAQDISGSARHDLLWVGLFVAAVDLIMAFALLRSVIGALILTLASMLVVASVLGLTALAFPRTTGYYGFTFYIPFAAVILLLSFGADYNLFVAGEIWEHARTQRFRIAVAEGTARAGSAVNTAGLTLALTFSALAIVPLTSFREMAFIMGIGLLLDTFVVRFLIVPVALDLIGPVATWPASLQQDEPGPGASRPPPHY